MRKHRQSKRRSSNKEFLRESEKAVAKLNIRRKILQATIIEMKLSEEDFIKASKSQHSDPNVNIIVCQLISIVEKLSAFAHRRSEVKMEMAKNKADNRIVTVPNEIIKAAEAEIQK